MKSFQIKQSVCSGKVRVPASKSHTLRAILLASLASGKSFIQNPLLSPDTADMIRACQTMGAMIEWRDDTLCIQGVAGCPIFQSHAIDVGNSGLVYRMITALAALSPEWITIDGDDSIRTRRLIQPLLDSLMTLGARVEYLKDNGHAPFRIRGPLQLHEHHRVEITCIDSQPATALILLAACLPEGLTLNILKCQEWPWLHVTFHWLDQLNISYTRHQSEVTIHPSQWIQGFDYTVPGDFSSALFPMLGAIITGGQVQLEGLIPDDPQGDRAVIDTLIDWGASCHWQEQSLYVSAQSRLSGGVINLSHCIDALPALMILGSQCHQGIQFTHYQSARFKESDRVYSGLKGLYALGGHAVLTDECITVQHSVLTGGVELSVESDHRLAMAWSIAGLVSEAPIVLRGVECVDKSYPGFHAMLAECGVDIMITQDESIDEVQGE